MIMIIILFCAIMVVFVEFSLKAKICILVAKKKIQEIKKTKKINNKKKQIIRKNNKDPRQ